MNLKPVENNSLIGKQFGYLKVLYKSDDYIIKGAKKDNRWHCVCLNCGTEKDIRQSSLKGKIGSRTRSCGCMSTKLTNEFLIKHNKYDLKTFNYGVGYTNKNTEFYFDLEDYDKIKEFYWQESDKGYIKNSQGTKLHQLIMGDSLIDHIDRNPKNNRKSNLRKCTKSQNAQNRDKPKNNTSGHKGVKLFKNKDWVACVRKEGKSYCKYFSINKYGYELAYKLACKEQEKMDLDLFKEFSIYYKENNNG